VSRNGQQPRQVDRGSFKVHYICNKKIIDAMHQMSPLKKLEEDKSDNSAIIIINKTRFDTTRLNQFKDNL